MLKIDTAYAMGFSKPSRGIPFGTSDRAFGAPGVGGSIGFADPDTAVGYAYVTNRMGLQLPTDAREKALRNAMYQCLGKP